MSALRHVIGLWHDESGQAVVETALFLPVLLLVLAGTIDLGRLSQFDTVLTSAAHAGAQYGSQSTTTAADISGMQTAATNDASIVSATASSYYKCADGTAPPVPPPILTMASTSTISCASNHKLLYVVVTTSGTFKPILLVFLKNVASQSRTAIMQVTI